MGFRQALTFAFVAACGLVVHDGPASARDPSPDDYVPYAPSGFFVFDWSGFYAGGHLGAAHGEAESTEVIFPESLEFFESVTYGNSQNSVTGGVQAGWQRQWGKLVAGIEAGFNMLQFDNDKISPLLVQFLDFPGITRSVAVRDIFLLTGRVGYADGRWLAYVKGGLANAEVDVDYRNESTDATTSSNGRETGWTAGLGIDYALTPNLFLGVEYNYIHFRTDVLPPEIDVAPTRFSDLDVDIQNVVVRLNYRFNGPCCIGPGGPPPPPR